MAGYFDPILPKHTQPIKPAHMRTGLKRHRQLPIFDGVKDNNHHVKMGLYYELLTSALFGGALIDRVIQLEDAHRYVGCKPDVRSKKRKEIHESKAVKQGAHLNILTDQIGRYTALQIIHNEYDMYFVVWRHSIKGIIKDQRTDDGFREELRTCTMAGIKIPLSLITTMYNSDCKECFRRYNSPGWDCVSVKSPYLNGLILDTENTIGKIADPKDYTWRRYRTPTGLVVDNIHVEPFPLIVIKDRTRKWVDSLINEVPF